MYRMLRERMVIMEFLITDILGGQKYYQRTAGQCPACKSLQWHVCREDDKTYTLRCYNPLCGHTEALGIVPGGKQERGGCNHTLTREMGLLDLPPTPPWSVPYFSEDPAEDYRIETLARRR